MTKWLYRALAGVVLVLPASVFAATVVVPTDQPTIQGAVNAAGAGGTVIINSNATFDETVTVTQTLTIHGGVGFTPTLRGAGTCGGLASCTLFFHPNNESPQMLAVSDLRLQPKAGTRGMSRVVVRVLNQGSGDASLILSNCTIDSSDGLGFQAVEIRRASCTAGLNHVSVQNGRIDIDGDNEAFAGEGGFDMPEGGSLNISNERLILSGTSAQMFRIAVTPNCGEVDFGLFDSQVSVTSTTTPFSADIAFLLLGVNATIERNLFIATSIGDGFTGGIRGGGGNVAPYTAAVKLNANAFFGVGRVGEALDASPFVNGSVTVTATNNVIHNMGGGFSIGQPIGNPAGTVSATLTNNTVDGSLSDAIVLNSADDAIVTVTLTNNLVTNSAGWGLLLSTEPGGMLTASADHNGFFANAAGNIQAPLTSGAHDVVGDPIYVDQPDGDLRLGIGSPMLNAGDNAAVTTSSDAAGAMRIQDGIVDIGALEGAFAVATPTSTASATPTATPQPTATTTRTAAATDTATRTATATHTLPASPSTTRTASRTASPPLTATAATPTPTHTPVASPTATRSASATAATATATRTSPSTATASATPASTTPAPHTPTLTPKPCVGDCDGSGDVGIDELLTMVNIALGRVPVTVCVAGDADHNGQISIAELLRAVNSALGGCP
jgi:hypothetical protein